MVIVSDLHHQLGLDDWEVRASTRTAASNPLTRSPGSLVLPQQLPQGEVCRSSFVVEFPSTSADTDPYSLYVQTSLAMYP